MSDSIQSQVQNYRQAQADATEGRKIKDVRELFVDVQEEQKAVIGGGYLSSMLHSGVLGKGFGVLTDRRLYYRGKCFYKLGGRYMKTDEDCTVDLQDITFTGFTYTRSLIWLVLTVLCGMMFLVLSFANEELVLGLIVPIVFFACLYYITKKTIYEVTFAGG